MKKIITLFIMFGFIFSNGQECKLNSLIGKWKGVSADGGLNENYEITFNEDLSFVKIINGVKTEGKYKLTRKTFKLYSCGKNETCKPYFGRLIIFGSTYKKMFHNDCKCQIRLPEQFFPAGNKEKGEAVYKYICYVRV